MLHKARNCGPDFQQCDCNSKKCKYKQTEENEERACARGVSEDGGQAQCRPSRGRIHRYDQALKTLRRAEGLPGESLIFRNRSTQEGTTIRTDAVVEVDGEGTRSGNRRSESNSVCVVCNELYTVLCVRGEQTLRSTIHEIHNFTVQPSKFGLVIFGIKFCLVIVLYQGGGQTSPQV